MPRLLSAAICAAIMMTPSPSAAQLPAGVDSALRTIFSGRGGGSGFRGARWNAAGTHYMVLERSVSGVEIADYDAATADRRTLVTAAQLTPRGASAPMEIADYAWSADMQRLLVFTNTRKVWRGNTRGDYWVLDVPSGGLHKVAATAAEATLMFAKFSPDGKRVAYVRGGDIYVESATGGPATALTHDGSTKRVNGMTDWVYEEEFGLRDAFRWSPDSRSIAFLQFDMTGIRDFLLINNTDSLYPFTSPVQYPKAGTTNSAVKLGIVPSDGQGRIRWTTLPGDPREHYIARVDWAGTDDVMLQYLDRAQQHDRVTMVNARTGVPRVILTEADSAWVDINDDITWLDGGRSFLWLSERDGWRHVYMVSRDGGAPALITPGAYDVIGIEGVDEAAKRIYIAASPENATQRYLYSVSLATPGAPMRVTPMSDAGTHSYVVSPGTHFAFHTYSRAGVSPRTELVTLPEHKQVRTLGRTTTAIASTSGMEFFQVQVPDGATLDGWMIKPRNFDPSKRYPLLMHVYGEPAAQTVMDAFGGSRDGWHHLLADQGYIVASVDTRGTPAPKGRAWRKVIYGSIGTIASREEADAVRVLTRTRPYLDSTRVGIWGWSGGGSSTLNAMFRYPDVYAMGMAVAPVADQRLYDTIYEERYAGLPSTNAAGYESGSPITYAAGLKGKLLVVHGTGDDNVHYQGTERLINRLVELGKPFDVMVYPNRSHCICEGTGTTLHVYSLLTRYLLTNLPAGGR